MYNLIGYTQLVMSIRATKQPSNLQHDSTHYRVTGGIQGCWDAGLTTLRPLP